MKRTDPDYDKDVPKLRAFRKKLVETIAGKQITPRAANQALGAYADGLLKARGAKPVGKVDWWRVP